MKKKVLVGLSGGVDSSVVAALLVEQDYSVVGGYMKNWINSDNIPGDCPWEQDINDAQAVAKKLGIELRVIDLTAVYQTKIVDSLLQGYANGITPNPDVFCNKEIKFGVFLSYAQEQGFDYVATGHYAKVVHSESLPAQLWRGKDNNKDQSYFLAMLNQRQLSQALFPLGDKTKVIVRQLAEKYDLPTATKKDSQGICFIGNVKMRDFLAFYLPNNPGRIVDSSGKILGQHQGLHFYTIGQRKGHGVASPKQGIAYVVVDKNYQLNTLVLDYEGTNNGGLYAEQAVITQCVWNQPLAVIQQCFSSDSVSIQPRYRTAAVTVQLSDATKQQLTELKTATALAELKLTVTFSTPQRALTVGQIAAFYVQEQLLGGGVFEQVYKMESKADTTDSNC